MIFITDAIKAINPTAVTSVVETGSLDTAKIQWLKGTPVISNADIQTKLDELQAEYDAQDYARVRDAAYPKWKEFAEAYTEKEIGGDSTKWDAYVIKYNKVRSDNQKP